MSGLSNLLVLQSVQIAPEAISLTDGKAQSWIQIAKPIKGAKKGKREFDITDAHIEQMMANAQKTSTEIPIDYNHLSLEATNPDQAIAAGWFKDFKLEGKNFFGLADWTDKAAEHIRRKEYRYVSPTINFAASDEHGTPIGARLISAALTIYPFLQGMEPVALSQLLSQQIVLADLSLDEKRARLSEAIRNKYPLDYAYLVDVFDSYVVFERSGKKWKLDYTVGSDFGVTFSGDAQEVVPQYEVVAATNPQPSGVPMSQPNNEQNQDLVALRAEMTTLTTTVQALSQRAEKSEADLKAEKERADALQLKLNTQEAEHAVDALIRAKKVKVDDKATYVKLYLKDKESYNEITATLQSAPLKLNVEHGSNARDTEDGESGHAQSAAIELDNRIKEYRKENKDASYTVALRAVTAADPELAERYRAEFAGPTTVVN